MTRRYPLHVHIAVLFVALILLVGGLLTWVGFYNSRNILEAGARAVCERMGREAGTAFIQDMHTAEQITRLLGRGPLVRASSHAARMESVPLMQEALLNSPDLSSVYAGFKNGDFFLLRRVHDANELEHYGAPMTTAFVVQSIATERGVRRGRFVFFDAALYRLGEKDASSYAAHFDPRERDWYRLALDGKGQVKTPPYVFHSSGLVGTTFANRIEGGKAVVGADMRLSAISRLLTSQKMTPGSKIALVDVNWRLIALDDPDFRVPISASEGWVDLPGLETISIPILAGLVQDKDRFSQAGQMAFDRSIGKEYWRVHIEPVQFEGTAPLRVISAIPHNELLADAHRQLRHAVMAIVAVWLLSIPVIIYLSRKISMSLRRLNDEAEAIRRFDFGAPVSEDSSVSEVGALAQTMGEMKGAIRRFIDISLNVAAEHNFDRLLPFLLRETLSAAQARGGWLYLNDADVLRPVAGSLADGRELNLGKAVSIASMESKLLGVALKQGAPAEQFADASEAGAWGIEALVADAQATHLVLVPLLNRRQLLVGAMLLLRRGETDANHLSFIGALAGSAAVSIETQELLQAQKRLFDALIQLIAGAIDAKSPYTAGHCARVPEIAQRLAQAACATREGAFADFRMGEDDLEALRIAAWLHDCGKLTTPEYVVDKATKLETIYDRLHEIRMRFEVLKRDAEIACLNAVADGTPEALARARLAEEWAQLDEDFAFVAACNEGGEFRAPERIERLERIATRTWQRTLDDRIGLGYEERARKARHPAPSLPVTEALLADKPEHLIECAPNERIPVDNPHGIRMTAPELRYNLGERYNLSIARGTLTAEERYKINEHIIQTIVMLGRMPFPRHLRTVPEIADNHHEKMNGTGYPRQLHGAEMSVLARIMAIADVFEALTAVDRPYKKGKTLSEALRIMAVLRDQQHIDAELFALFVRSGVYLDYAREFMRPEQIDVVDPQALLA